jgi:hypothetical protein
MRISALNFFWLTDPHDLQGIPTPGALSYVFGTSLPKRRVNARRHTVLPRQRLGEVVSPSAENRPFRSGSGKRREKLPT